jgi:hypothetical protein
VQNERRVQGLSGCRIDKGEYSGLMKQLIDWSHIVTFAAGGAATALVRTLFIALVQEPARALMNRHQVIRFLSSLWPLKHEAFSGNWEFEWKVDSKNFHRSNKDRVQFCKFLHFVAAELETRTRSGTRIKYGFVGQMYGSIVTGKWYDIRDPDRGYYGTFQVVMAGTMQSAEGKWLGFAKDASVKTGDLLWKRLA